MLKFELSSIVSWLANFGVQEEEIENRLNLALYHLDALNRPRRLRAQVAQIQKAPIHEKVEYVLLADDPRVLLERLVHFHNGELERPVLELYALDELEVALRVPQVYVVGELVSVRPYSSRC